MLDGTPLSSLENLGEPVAEGAFSAALAIEAHRMLTRESTEHYASVLVVALRLESGGAASLEVSVRGDSSWSRSHFAPGGEAHSRNALDDRWRFDGSWRAEGEWAHVELTRPPNPSGARLALRCRRARLGDLELLACELTDGGNDLPALEDRDGPSRSWLLGLEPALITADQGFHDRVPRISARRAERPVGDAELDGTWRFGAR